MILASSVSVFFNNLETSTTKEVIINKTMFVSKELSNPAENYTFLNSLGEGSYGKVIKSVHKLTNSVRAIKIIKKSGKPQSDEEVRNEINMLTMMDHPNIVKIFEFYITPKEYYLVTEYCQGGELFEKIVEMAPLNEDISATIMYQILSAVAYCHKLDIIHRDLKPENILFTGENLDRNVRMKIVDFGTAKIFDRAGRENKVIGSSYYIAPEVLDKNYNEKCDLWSCGVILYILLTGEAPFGGDNDHEIIKNIKQGRLSFRKLNKVSDEALDLVKKLLIKNPKERISAEEALKHPWFLANNTKASINNVDEKTIYAFIDNLKNYTPGSLLQQATMGFLVHNNPQLKDVVDASKLFNLIDTNGDGQIVKAELFEGLRKILNTKQDGLSQLKDDVNQIFEHLDADGNDYLEYGEFIRAAIDRRQFINQRDIRFAFQHFDLDRTGEIEIDEIKNIFGKFKENIEEHFYKIIREVDLNGDSKISYYEFETMMKNILK
jgi:calcium-dependent protein kinase